MPFLIQMAWTDEILEARANQYGLSVQEYKTKNILMVEITSKDVAELVAQMLEMFFLKLQELKFQ